MPPKEASGGLTARETELVAAWVKCMESKPTSDYEKFAALTGYANAKSAIRNMNKLWNKLNDAAIADGDGSDASASPKKRKADADLEIEGETLAKKKAASKKGKKGVKATDEEALGEEVVGGEGAVNNEPAGKHDTAVKDEFE